MHWGKWQWLIVARALVRAKLAFFSTQLMSFHAVNFSNMDFNTLNIQNSSEFRQHYIYIILRKCNINIKSEQECYLWDGCLNDDYGHMSYTYKVLDENDNRTSEKHYTTPSRLMFACTFDSLYLLDPDFKHKEVSHTCHTPRCCNPLHLELETGTQNGSRTICKKGSRSNKQCLIHDPPCIF